MENEFQVVFHCEAYNETRNMLEIVFLCTLNNAKFQKASFNSN